MARTTPVNAGYTIINGTATGSNGYRVDVWLEYKVLSQSILNNTSELHLLLYAAATYSSTTKWETPGNYGYVGYDGGNQQYLSTTYDFSGYAVNKFGDYTYTIAHNSNGQKSITAQGAFTTLSSYISGGSASGTVVLPTIARATTLTAQSATLGTEKTFTLSPADASFKHSMSFTFGSASGSITGVTALTSIAYTFSVDLAAQVPNATSGAGTLTISTYASDGTTLIGTSTATVTLSVPASVVPTGTVDIEEGVTGIAAQFGAYIRSKSKLSVSIDASGAYGSTIVGYATTIESTVYSGATFTSGFLAQSGAKTAVTVITDSRGRTTTINTNYTVAAYENPVIETFTAVRCDSVGTPDDEGSYVLVSLKGSVSAANNGNTASYQVLYKKTTDESYTTYTFSESGYAIDDNDIISSISPDYTWDFVAKITDYFTSTQRPLTISTAATIMDFKSDGLGISIGKVAENAGLEVDWPATFNDAVDVLGALTVNSNIVWDGNNLVYETGTWTPTLYGESTEGTIVYAENYGFYVKIGDLVQLSARIRVTSVSAAMGGSLRVGGQPFNLNAGTGNRAVGNVITTGVNWGTSTTQTAAYMYSGNILAIVGEINNGTFVYADASLIAANDVVILTITYLAA